MVTHAGRMGSGAGHHSTPDDASSGDPDVGRLLRLVEFLRQSRLDQGLKLGELSERMNIDHAHLSRSERGLTQPGLVVLLRWCRALNRDFDDLFQKTKRSASESSGE